MTDSKDRFGDKLRDKERGDESKFAAEQDAAALALIRERKQKAALWEGHCPKDGAVLEEIESDGVRIDRCPDCAGVWLDAGELPTIVERRGESWASTWLRSILGS